MDRQEKLRVAIANVAGGRLTSAAGGYDAADRTSVFARELRRLRPDVVVVSELDCGQASDQLERLAAGVFGGRATHQVQQAWSDSHIPGVGRLGVGVAARYELRQLGRIELPQPEFRMLMWNTGEESSWHKKGMLVTECQTPAGPVSVVAGQIQPIHMARSEDGVEYSYRESPGREFGERTVEHLRTELAQLGVGRAVIAGDLNMPNPREFFTHLADGTRLRDAFGAGEPPATTPDGRSIDRAFVTDNLTPIAHRVVPVPGADHHICRFTVRPERQGRDSDGGRLRGRRVDRDHETNPRREGSRDTRSSR